MKDARGSIRAGALRHQGTIEQFQKTTAGDRGQPVGAWVALYSGVWFDVEPLSGRLLEISRQLCATATHRVTMRYHSGITAAMRLTYQGRHFNIGWVDEGDFKRHDMHLLVIEQQTGAT